MNQSQITLEPLIAPPARRTLSGSYAQVWPAYNRAQVCEKDELMILLRELCRGVEEPPRPPNGRPSLPRRDMICAAVLKVYAARSARRFMCELEVARERGLITHIPHYNSVLNVMTNESLTPVFQQLVTESGLPLRVVERFFAADSTSLGTRVRRTWYDRRDERYRTRQETVKLHVMIGAKTHVITHAVVSNGTAADSPFFRELVRNTASHFDLLEVSADAGYFAAENMREALMAGAIPYIAFRSNSTGSGWRAKSAFWDMMLALYRDRRPEFMEHYYRRNNVETTFSMLKAKFGRQLRGKLFRAQANEVLCMALCHNLCVVIQSMHELGIAPAFWAEAAADAKGGKATSSVNTEGGRDRLAPALMARPTVSRPGTRPRELGTRMCAIPNKAQMTLCFQPTTAATEILAHGEHQQSAPTRETSCSDRPLQAIKGQLRMF